MEGQDKVCVIGLDGATLSLVGPWAQAGELPVLRGLMEEGVTGILRSTIPPITPAAWTSFATGKNPGKHGVFDHIYRREGSYEVEPVSSRLCAAKTLWRLISEGGKKVGVINVPLTYPPQEVNGFLVTGMFTPSDRVEFTYPPSLAGELKREVGGYMVGGTRPKEDYQRFLDQLYVRQKNRMETALYLMRRYDCDFFMVVFNGTDLVQHKFWKFMDEKHPQHDPRGGERYRQAILEFYRQADEDLGRIIEALGEEVTLVIMSDHGAGVASRYFVVNNWLLREGFLRLKDGLLTRLKYHLFRGGYTPLSILNALSRLGFGIATRAFAMGNKPGLLRKAFLSWLDIDWSETMAYALGHLYGQIYLNVEGREPQGKVRPGREYEELREQAIRSLAAATEDDSGEKIVGDIYRKEEIYSGPYIDRAPDILFALRDRRSMALAQQQFSSHLLFDPAIRVSASHRMGGLLMMRGPGVRKGAELEGTRIIDLAPTILYILGLDIPSDMDGRVLEEAFEESFLTRRRIRYGPPSPLGAGLDSGFDEEESQEIRDRLRGLGYLS
ncbi:MAG: alkaline phosphatase family protein [Anaerolineae bacterium]